MKQEQILLIVPPFTYSQMKEASTVAPHLGIAFIAAVIETKGYKVKIIDSQALKLSLDQIKKEIENSAAKIIGVTAVTAEYKQALEVFKIIKKINKDIITILGGPHVTIMPQTALNEWIDYLIIGEGELTITELVDYISNKKGELDQIDGLAYKVGNALHFNRPRELIKNIDDIPFPAYHLLPMGNYKNYSMWDEGRKFVAAITSRGCPYRCIYCTSSQIFGKMWRAMSPQKVLEMIKILYYNYGIRHIYFQDDEFTINHKRVEEICDLIIKEGFDLHWGCLSRVDRVEENLIKKMYDAGCREIVYGVECGYQEGLEKIKKNITLEEVTKAVKITVKNKILVSVSFIMGFPWENESYLNKTINFAKSLPADMIFFSILVPYPGTELYNEIKEGGLIESDDWDRFIHHSITGSEPIIKTKYLTNKQLKYWNAKAYRQVYLNPRFLLRKIIRVRNSKQLLHNLKAGIPFIKMIKNRLKKDESG